MSKKNIDNIGHEAHIYGALGGMILITIIKPGIWVSFFNQLFKNFG
jgi:membrane associated rhomboid family serine protease